MNASKELIEIWQHFSVVVAEPMVAGEVQMDAGKQKTIADTQKSTSGKQKSVSDKV